MKHPFKKKVGEQTITAHPGGWPIWFTLTHLDAQENPCEAVRYPTLGIDEVRDLHYALGEAIRWYESND